MASVDGSFKTELSFSDGSLMLEDATTAMGVIEPLARFGPSAFGPIQVRAVSAEGVAGDWLPLGTLVRIPGYKELRCPRATSKPCTLSGSNLFLTSAVASTPAFDNATGVPPDFTGLQLMVPHPTDGVLYVKLRDDPATVQMMTLPVTPQSVASRTPPLPSEAVPASAPSSASETPASDQAAPPTTPTASPTEPAAAPQAAPPATAPQSLAQPVRSPAAASHTQG